MKAKFEELKKKRIEKDGERHEYGKIGFKNFVFYLKQPYRFYRNDFDEWMKGYNAKPKVQKTNCKEYK